MFYHQITLDVYCPACAMQRRNEGKRVAVLSWKLCADHLKRLVAMLHSPYPDADVLLFWAKYAKVRSAFASPYQEADG